MANSETSSPSMNSSMSISRPAAPNTRSLSIALMARSASTALCATITPFPAARPDAFITTGMPKSASAAFASLASLCCTARAVGIPARTISSFANRFDVSMRAASRVGPKIGRPRARKRFAIAASKRERAPARRRRRSTLSCERLLQVGEKVPDVFDAARESKQIIPQTKRSAPLGGNRSVGHGSGVADQALDAAERLGEGKDAHLAEDLGRLLLASGEHREHSAKALHLTLGQLVLGMRSQARVNHVLVSELLREPGCDPAAVLVVTRHPQMQSLGACLLY